MSQTGLRKEVKVIFKNFTFYFKIEIQVDFLLKLKKNV